MKIKLLLLIFGLLLTSCAERYSTRKRDTTSYKSTTKKNKKAKNSTTKYVTSKQPIKTKQRTNISKAENPIRDTNTEIPASSNAKGTTKKVIDTAFSYLGTPYRYGGTTRSGMDCSGFVCTVYKTVGVPLSRSSTDMANQGNGVKLNNIRVGDLLFFATGKTNRISHVGIVVETGSEVKFIHSSTSRGVIVSSLNEGYWSKAYRKAKRVM